MSEDPLIAERPRRRPWWHECALLALIVIGLPALLLWLHTPGPTRDAAVLQALQAEATLLMKTLPATGDKWVDVPLNRLPPTIASLKPEFVDVSKDGVDIVTRPYFDGGWGYFIASDPRHKPGPAGRFTQLSPGVYWYHPY